MSKLYLITGDDAYGIKNAARQIMIDLCGDPPEDNPGLEIVKGDDETKKAPEVLGEFINTINTPPFLSPEKIVWLKHFQYFDKVLAGTAKDRKGSQIEMVESFIKAGLPPDLHLIIDGPDIKRNNTFFKTCDKFGTVSFHKKPDLAAKDYVQNQIIRIKTWCDKVGKQMEYHAESYLIEIAGSDSGRLDSELEKLFCYVDGRDLITLDDCRTVCSRTPEALAWAFADALMEKNTAKALGTIGVLTEQMRASRGDYGLELSLLNGAVRRFQELLKVKAAGAELNIPKIPSKSFFYQLPESTKERFPSNYLISLHPFRAYNLCLSAGKFPENELGGVLSELMKTNRQLVSGGAKPRIALEQLTIKITGSN